MLGAACAALQAMPASGECFLLCARASEQCEKASATMPIYSPA